MMRVPDARSGLRTPRPPADFVPDRYRPAGRDFTPSGDDKAEAKRRGTPVRVSVWDSELTTSREAAAFREPGAVLVLAGVVGEIVAIRDAVTIVYDPLDPPESSRPGAAGHAGIEGLDRKPGIARDQHMAFLDDVAAAFELLERIDPA